MPEDDQKPKSKPYDNHEQFRTRKRSEVVSNLHELSRRITPLTIFFDAGKFSFPTSVIDVSSDDDKVVLERASSEAMNNKLLGLQKGTVVGEPDGVKVNFLLEPISAAERKGEKVLVAPLPKEHYRMQRRQLFRVNTQIRLPVKISLALPDARKVTLTAGNISSGGLRLDDVDHVLQCEAMQVLSGCSIEIPDVEPFLIDLKVRNSYELRNRKGDAVHYVGCEFLEMRASHEKAIQNYINRLQLAQRALAK